MRRSHYRSQGTNGKIGGTLDSEFYLRETVGTNAALNSIIPLPAVDELSAEPTVKEFGQAIDALLNG